MARSAFECCHYCKPPKRKPGCQDHCPDMEKAKEIHKELKAADDKARHRNTSAVYTQHVESMARACKKRKGRRY